MSKNFEAIGRYTDATERVTSLSCQRHNLAAELARLLSKASLFSSSDTVQAFDHAAVVKKAEELAQINVQLEVAIADANSYALAAEKPTIRRV